MLKKIKVIATLSALCIAILSLTVGVYAASSIRYTLQGDITYVTKEVLIDITTNVYFLSGDAGKVGYTTSTAAQSAVNTGTLVAAKTESGANIGPFVDKTYNGSNATEPLGDLEIPRNIDIMFHQSTVWVFKFTCESFNNAQISIDINTGLYNPDNTIATGNKEVVMTPNTTDSFNATPETYVVILAAKSAMNSISDLNYKIILEFETVK